MGEKREREREREVSPKFGISVAFFGYCFSSPKLRLQNPNQWSYGPFDALSRPCSRNLAMAFVHSALCWCCCCWLLARAIEEGGDASEEAWICERVSREGIPFFSRKMSDCAPCCCVWADFGELIRARRRREEGSQGERERERGELEGVSEETQRLAFLSDLWRALGLEICLAVDRRGFAGFWRWNYW
jgi:hypothetical protein